jgi:hypothetical protein
MNFPTVTPEENRVSQFSTEGNSVVLLDSETGDEVTAYFQVMTWAPRVCRETDDAPTTSSSEPVDDGTTTVSGSDPAGDFVDGEALAGRGFDLVEENPPSGLDIINVDVDYRPDGDRTIITIRFAGPAQNLEDEDGRSVVIRTIFRRDSEYWFEIEYMGGTAYVSGGPEGTSLATEWLSPDTLRVTLDGQVPDAGDQVRVNVFSRVETGDGTAVAEDDATVDIG